MLLLLSMVIRFGMPLLHKAFAKKFFAAFVSRFSESVKSRVDEPVIKIVLVVVALFSSVLRKIMESCERYFFARCWFVSDFS